jgi:ABC-type nitrate/sulfonate/bicarbonate transport system ATPase subunit
VTHDLVEAATLADRILTLSATPARIVSDVSVPAELRRKGGDAATRFVAALREAAGKRAAPA